MPELNTSSLPDLIFSILFFFMIVTSMREVELKVEFKTPQGTELEKLERKSLVSNIYIGKAQREYRSKFGTGSCIQVNDKFIDVSGIASFVYDERGNLSERDKPYMKIVLKSDVNTKMGIITDVKMLGADLLSDLVPGVEKLAEAFRGIMSGDAGAADDFGAVLSDMITGLLDKVTELAPTIGEVAISLISSLTRSSS